MVLGDHRDSRDPRDVDNLGGPWKLRSLNRNPRDVNLGTPGTPGILTSLWSLGTTGTPGLPGMLTTQRAGIVGTPGILIPVVPGDHRDPRDPRDPRNTPPHNFFTDKKKGAFLPPICHTAVILV